ncbi:hypothetical protein C8R47DRAFT_1229309 [Mycena vitilis]|nr:hypothetical protein C8R47DRAFT_1229309 [Mycena vitilis]
MSGQSSHDPQTNEEAPCLVERAGQYGPSSNRPPSRHSQPASKHVPHAAHSAASALRIVPALRRNQPHRHPVHPRRSDEEELDPEDFARDVLIELMRILADRLKLAESTKERIETLAEIQRIMTQDALGATKDVFREMDGFVGLMSALSMASPDDSDDTKERSRLAFVITSDAIS